MLLLSQPKMRPVDTVHLQKMGGKCTQAYDMPCMQDYHFSSFKTHHIINNIFGVVVATGTSQ